MKSLQLIIRILSITLVVCSSLAHANTPAAGNCEPTNDNPNYYRINIENAGSLRIHPGIGRPDTDAFNPVGIEILYGTEDTDCSTPIGYNAHDKNSGTGNDEMYTSLHYMKGKLSKLYKNKDADTYQSFMVLFDSTHDITIGSLDADTDPFNGKNNNAISHVKHSVTLGTNTNYCKQTAENVSQDSLQGDITIEGEIAGTPCEVEVTLSTGSRFFGDLIINKESITYGTDNNGKQTLTFSRTGKNYIEVQLFKSRQDIIDPNIGSPLTMRWGMYDGDEEIYFSYPDGTLIE
jgi:hypothetical protein